MKSAEEFDNKEVIGIFVLPEFGKGSKVEMMISDIQLTDVPKFESKEPTKTYLDALKMDAQFWKDYSVLQNSPIEMKVITDLEKRAALSEQFEK